MRTVATRANNVDQVSAVRYMHLSRKLPHHLGSCRDLANGLFLDAKPGDDCRRHNRRQLAIHDHTHDLEHLIVKNLSVLDGALQGFLWGNWHGHILQIQVRFNQIKRWGCR